MKVAGNYPGVSADWVKKQIDSNANMVLIDSRPKRKKYDKGHIPTAISIPDSQFAKMQDQLPADKDFHDTMGRAVCGRFVSSYCRSSIAQGQPAVSNPRLNISGHIGVGFEVAPVGADCCRAVTLPFIRLG